MNAAPPKPFDPTEALAVIAAWPDGRVHPRIVTWLIAHGLGPDRIAVHNVRHVVRAYNRAVRDIALPSRFDWFVFFDNDLVPGKAAEPFLQAAGDVVGCRYPIVNEPSWDDPAAFHTGLWRCHRGVLETLSPPWFLEEYTADGCELARCVCGYFRDKAQAAGFAIARAGWADHTPDRRSGRHA